MTREDFDKNKTSYSRIRFKQNLDGSFSLFKIDYKNEE